MSKQMIVISLGRQAISLPFLFFFQAEDGIRDLTVTGVQTCALPISARAGGSTPADRGEARPAARAARRAQAEGAGRADQFRPVRRPIARGERGRGADRKSVG